MKAIELTTGDITMIELDVAKARMRSECRTVLNEEDVEYAREKTRALWIAHYRGRGFPDPESMVD